jgi:hypothetical protein
VLELSATVPRTLAPGLPIVALGGVLSTRVETGSDAAELPALSVAITRRS